MSDRQIIPADQIMPSRLFIMPLTGKPIFPGIFTPIMIQEEDDIEVIDKIILYHTVIAAKTDAYIANVDDLIAFYLVVIVGSVYPKAIFIP